MMETQNILNLMRSKLGDLNSSFKRIAIYILGNADKVKFLRIHELASECDVSDATISRFSRKLGFNGFPELKIAVAESALNQLSPPVNYKKIVYDDVKRNDSIETIINKVTFKNIETLNATKEIVSVEEIEKAIDVIGKVNLLYIYCSGSSSVAGNNLKSRFNRIGKRCLLFTDGTEQCLSASQLGRKSVAIGITSSGRTKTVVNAMRIAKEAGAKTICITDSPASPIVSYSDIKFFTSSSYSNFMTDSMTSRMPHILIIDILYACFAVSNYTRSLQTIEKSTNAISKSLFYS